MTLTSIITYLASNKAVLIGAATAIAELTTIAVNLYRKLKAEKSKVSAMSASDEACRPSKTKQLLWAANPINLFRAPV